MINTDTVIPCHYLKPHIDPVRSSEVHSWERKVRIGAISMIALGALLLTMTLCAVLAKRGFLPQWLSGLNSLGKMGWGSIVVLSSVSAFPLIGGLVFYCLWKSSRHLFLKVEASKKLADRFQVGEYAIFYDEDENIAVAAFAGDVRLNAPPSACAIPRHYSLEQGVMRFPEEMRQRQLTLEEIQQRL